ncbi:MAG: LexA family transcriptional regulator [Bacteroidia bacterium]|nr:LexA family transcriptional regulator [Bacteroidia bacterium]
MSKFASNIKYLRNRKSLSQQALADDLEISRGQLASYEDARAEPSLEKLIGISGFFKLPVDTLIKHDITKSKEDSFIDVGENRILFPIIVTEDNKDLIEVVPNKAVAGYLNGYSDPEYIASLPVMKLPFVPIGKHRAFPIKGDSMEPLVKDGAIVIAKFIENTSDLRKGQTYIVVTQNDGLVYKRVFKKDKEHLTLHSDNKFYPPYEVHLSEVLELWEYTCKIDIQDYTKEELNLESIMQMMRSFQVELKDIKKKVS